MRSDKRVSELDDQALFQEWVEVMDVSLDAFTTMLPREVKQQLDYTPESLNVLERWILDRYPTYEDLIAESEVLELDGLSRYVGETIRKHTNSEWQIDYSDPKDAYYALPYLDFGKRRAPICPQQLVTASADRRTGHYLSTLARKVIGSAAAAQD